MYLHFAHAFSLATVVTVALACSACSADSDPPPALPTDTCSTAPGGGLTLSAGDGAALATLDCSGIVEVDSIASGARRHFELSLAIFRGDLPTPDPATFEGENYPSDPAQREAIVGELAYGYDKLFSSCASLHPSLVARITTADQAGLWSIARVIEACANEDAVAQRTWIPRLLVDVDVCKHALGEGWRMPTITDLGALSDAERTALSKTLDPTLALGWPRVFALDGVGGVVEVSLDTGVVESLADEDGYPAGYLDTVFFRGPTALRCLRGAP